MEKIKHRQTPLMEGEPGPVVCSIRTASNCKDPKMKEVFQCYQTDIYDISSAIEIVI